MLVRKGREYHIHSTDGSTGFAATFKSLNQLHINSAIHSKDIFTPVEVLKGSGLSSATKSVVSRMTKEQHR